MSLENFFLSFEENPHFYFATMDANLVPSLGYRFSAQIWSRATRFFCVKNRPNLFKNTQTKT
jgi:hypothetical protein